VTDTKERPTAGVRLLKIHEAAADVGLTARSVRYYEEMGLMRPAARSDDAGFSLAEISRLLEDEEARERDHAAYHATADPVERLRLLRERVASFERQSQTLKTKIDRLAAMVEDTEARRLRSLARIAEIETTELTQTSEPPMPAEPARPQPGASSNR
jgi:DNA-binding transcriptional MerR regulator